MSYPVYCLGGPEDGLRQKVLDSKRIPGTCFVLFVSPTRKSARGYYTTESPHLHSIDNPTRLVWKYGYPDPKKSYTFVVLERVVK